MSVQNGSIVFDDPKPIFYSGQTVTGNVKFELRDSVPFSAINVECLGEANVLWTEYESEEVDDSRRVREVQYKGHEEYIRRIVCVSGSTGATTLPPGRHSLPFSFLLPHICPSSFKGYKGSVSYKMTAFFNSNVGEEKIIQKFYVVAPFNLNLGSPAVRNPISLEFEEYNTCCFNSDPLNISVQLPASGFCPGQRVPVTVTVDNKASIEVTKIIFNIIQKEMFHAQHPRSDYTSPETVLATMKRGPVLSKTEGRYVWDLDMPEIMAPYLENCSIIDVGYFFKVTIKLSGCNDDLQDETEICLGLVPLEGMVNNYKHPLSERLPAGPIPEPPPPGTKLEPDVPPPVTLPDIASNFFNNDFLGSMGFNIPGLSVNMSGSNLSVNLSMKSMNTRTIQLDPNTTMTTTTMYAASAPPME